MKIIIKKIKEIKNKYSVLHFIFNTIFRPKSQYEKYVIGFAQFFIFYLSSISLQKRSKQLKVKSKETNENLFICSGENIESSWLQIWITISLLLVDKVDNIFVLSSKKEIIPNFYFYIFRFKVIFIEDLKNEIIYDKLFNESWYFNTINFKRSKLE